MLICSRPCLQPVAIMHTGCKLPSCARLWLCWGQSDSSCCKLQVVVVAQAVRQAGCGRGDAGTRDGGCSTPAGQASTERIGFLELWSVQDLLFCWH
jgi:hypothetical protein